MEHSLRDKIIEQAQTMYVEEGFKNVRMDDIARAIGISKRTLYEVIGDKSELIYLAMHKHFTYYAEINERIATEAPDVLTAMLRVIRNVVNNSKTNWRLHNALLKYHPAIEKRIFEEDQELRQSAFRAFLQSGIDEGLLVSRTNLDLAMLTLQHVAQSVVIKSNGLRLPESVTPQMAFMELTTNVMRGISTPKGIEIIDNYIEIERGLD